MAEPELPRPPSIASLSIASLPKNPSEVKGTTSQGVLDKESRPGGIVPEADEKAELDNEDHAISGRCRFFNILIDGINHIDYHQIKTLPRRRPIVILSMTLLCYSAPLSCFYGLGFSSVPYTRRRVSR